MASNPPPVAFVVLSSLEPQLALLAVEATAVSAANKPHFCANIHWYADFKPRLIYCVGALARNPRLRSPEDYDVAYDYIYSLLPNCRDCLCA